MSETDQKDLYKLTAVLDELKIDYALSHRGDYSYLFIGECRSIHFSDLDIKKMDLDQKLSAFSFYEFEHGELVSTPFNYCS